MHKYPIKRKVPAGGCSMGLSYPSQQILITEQTSKENLVELGIRLRKLLECSKKSNKSRQEVKRLARLVEQERTHCDPDKSSVLDNRRAVRRDSMIVLTNSHSRRPSSTSSTSCFPMKQQQHRQIMDASTNFPQSWKGNTSSTARKVSISPGPLESSLPRLGSHPSSYNGCLSSPLPTETSILTEGNGKFFSPLMDNEVQKFQSQFFPSW